MSTFPLISNTGKGTKKQQKQQKISDGCWKRDDDISHGKSSTTTDNTIGTKPSNNAAYGSNDIRRATATTAFSFSFGLHLCLFPCSCSCICVCKRITEPLKPTIHHHHNSTNNSSTTPSLGGPSKHTNSHNNSITLNDNDNACCSCVLTTHAIITHRR
jgi:hypothetical protein